MKVQDLMTRQVETCAPAADLADVAMRMWRSDCGIVPILEEGTGKLVGVVTDRDICMAAATRHQPLCELPVSSLMTTEVHTCAPRDDIRTAMRLMGTNRMRRLPVVGLEGRLEGILSINDLILASARERAGDRHPADPGTEEVLATLRAICAHAPKQAEAPDEAHGAREPAGRHAHDRTGARELAETR